MHVTFPSKLAALACLATTTLSAPTLKRQSTIPDYVLSYAPVVWLANNESYFPAPISSQLLNTQPEVNFAPVSGAPSPLTLDNLNSLNSLGGANVSLSSTDDFTKYPSWLSGTKPDSSGKVAGDPSAAIIVSDRGNGTVYAFYMYFYAFNLGNVVFGTPAGNHVGDWEHNAILFQDGVPQSVWFSQHSDGEAFTYDAVQKQGQRVVDYSATGSHANYAIPGTHDHTIPGLNLPTPLFLVDYTSQGTLWDPTLNAYTFSYDASADSFTAYDGTSPTNWLTYQGIWGDEELPSSDPRQHYFLGIEATAEWTGGPTGPNDKNLNRGDVCEKDPCDVRGTLGARR